MKLKNLLQIFILLIISGFISSLFVAKALEKKVYKHELNFVRKVIVDEEEKETLNCKVTLVTDTKEKFDDFSKLAKYLDKHLVEDNKDQYFMYDATGTFYPFEDGIAVKAFSYNPIFGFSVHGEYETDMITFVSFRNEVSDYEIINTITDKVSRTKGEITESKLQSDFNFISVAPGDITNG